LIIVAEPRDPKEEEADKRQHDADSGGAVWQDELIQLQARKHVVFELCAHKLVEGGDVRVQLADRREYLRPIAVGEASRVVGVKPLQLADEHVALPLVVVSVHGAAEENYERTRAGEDVERDDAKGGSQREDGDIQSRAEQPQSR
jgi:hypothetical protein